jgi:hypothetical protein
MKHANGSHTVMDFDLLDKVSPARWDKMMAVEQRMKKRKV